VPVHPVLLPLRAALVLRYSRSEPQLQGIRPRNHTPQASLKTVVCWTVLHYLRELIRKGKPTADANRILTDIAMMKGGDRRKNQPYDAEENQSAQHRPSVSKNVTEHFWLRDLNIWIAAFANIVSCAKAAIVHV
jgi:hypothetical protein